MKSEHVQVAFVVQIFSASLTAHGDPHTPNAVKPSPPSVEDVRWARSVQTDTASAVDAFLDEQQCTAWIVPGGCRRIALLNIGGDFFTYALAGALG